MTEGKILAAPRQFKTFGKLRNAFVEDFAGMVHRAATNVEHFGCVVLGRCANLRTLAVRPDSIADRRYLRRDHAALAFVEVPPCYSPRAR
jgi:hypothetical protein